MPLLNVRLGPEDASKAAALRSAGVPISALVRGAIRSEYERRIGPGRGRRRPSEVVSEILERLPDEPAAGRRGFALTDRRAIRRHIRARLGRRR